MRTYRIDWCRGERQSSLGHRAYQLQKNPCGAALRFSRVFRFPPQFAPVSGEVLAINEKLGGQPSLLNKSPEDEGVWQASHRASCSSTHVPRQVGFSNSK